MKRKRTLAQLLNDAAHKAETSKEYPTCPNCGAVLPDSYRTDDVTSESDENDDPDNEGDAAELPDYDNRRAIDRLNALAHNLARASNKPHNK